MSASPTKPAKKFSRQYPISNTGLAHIPRAWIHGAQTGRSLCNYLTNVWKGKGIRWGGIDDARRACHACMTELNRRVHWYEELIEDIGGSTRGQMVAELREKVKELEGGKV